MAGDAKGYEAKLSSALKFRAQGGREERWKRYTQRLAHIYYAGGVGEESPTVNIMAARIRSLVPQLAIGVPSVKVESYFKPRDPNSEPAIAQVLEMLWRSEGMDDTTRRVTLDAETFGIGIGFMGYETTWGDGEIINRSRKLFGVMPTNITEKLSDWTSGAIDKFATEEVEALKKLMAERCFMDRVSPLNFFIDPTADHFSNASYMGRRLFLTEKQAKAIVGAKAPTADSIVNVGEAQSSDDVSGPFGNRESTELSRIIDDKVRRAVVYELWDITEHKTVYLDKDGKHLKTEPWKSTFQGFPFVPMLWDEIPDRVYPEGLAAALEPLTNELNLIRRRQLQNLRKGINKWWTRGQLSAKARQGLMSDRDNEIIEGGEFDDLEPLTQIPLPSDQFTIEARVKSDMDEMSHTSSMQASGSMPVRKTATETAFIQSSADAMTGYRQLMVENFAARSFEILLTLVTTLFDTPLPVKLVNADPELTDELDGTPLAVGELLEYKFIGIQHEGLYKVTVEPGSMVAAARDVEIQQLMAVYQIFAPEQFFDKRSFATLVLSKLASVRDASKYIKTDTQMAGVGANAPVEGMGQSSSPLSAAGLPPGMMPPQGGSGPAPASVIPTYGNVNPSAEGDALSAMLGAAMGG